MTDEWGNITIGGRVYIPLLHLDQDGRQVVTKVRDRSNPPFNSRVVKPYACSECAALTIDPKAHNEAHDGPACDLCGCTENQACDGGCHWVSLDPPLCSQCDARLTRVEQLLEADHG